MHKLKVNNKNLLNLMKKIQFFNNKNCKLVSTQISTEKTAKNSNFEPQDNSNLNLAGTSASNHTETSTSTSPSTEILKTSEKFTGSSLTNFTSTSPPTSTSTSTSTSVKPSKPSEKFNGPPLTNFTSTSPPTSTLTSVKPSKPSEEFTGPPLTNFTSTSPPTSDPTSTSFSTSTSKPSKNVFRPPLTNSTSTSTSTSPPTSITASTSTSKSSEKFSGPSLSDFISTSLPTSTSTSFTPTSHPYLPPLPPQAQKVYFDVYGCQMNVSDTEIVYSILKSAGYQRTLQPEEADVILVMTCAIRDGAEQKVWGRLAFLNDLRRRRHFIGSPPLRVGLLGCMAERLKKKILEESKYVDLVAGPDAYRDLPRLLTVTDGSAINVALSFDETYADINPVRLNGDSKSAFVTIMRGCDNMCTYCIVPFVRGRERSRPMRSILEEVRHLADSGVKEVTLLGQNVNSYRDLSEEGVVVGGKPAEMAKGFKTVYKKKIGGKRFADLLEKVAEIDPEMRIRFTSPHPKDFPDEVLTLISSTPNICKQIHLPAQSGNSSVLERMRRGYTRESYLDLVDHIRDLIPTIQLSSDFIAGFCGETDAEFEDTMTLIDKIEYHMAYLFHYSMREKTTAHRRYQDDVPQEVKLQRHHRMSDLFRSQAERLNKKLIGTKQLVLVEGVSRRSDETLQGRTDGNTRVLIPNIEVPDGEILRGISAGEYVEVKIVTSNSNSLTGVPLCHSSVTKFLWL